MIQLMQITDTSQGLAYITKMDNSEVSFPYNYIPIT